MQNKTYYVDAHTTFGGDGSALRPFKRINDAARVATAGDTVIVKDGIYREYVNPVNGGTEDSPIVYKSENPLGAVIVGSEELTNWVQYKGNVWTASVKNSVFGAYNPYTTFVGGDWYFAPMVRHTGSVWLNDRMMYETVTLEDCIKGEKDECAWKEKESTYKWFSEQKDDTTVLYANFQGLNPNEQNVEIAVRRNCFFPQKTGVNYITVSGFKMKNAATTWAPPAAFQDGLIGPHWSKGWIIEDCEIYNSKCCGISLGKYLDEENDMYFTKYKVKSPTQMERDAVCRGQYHGWLKENIGHHTVRRCDVHHCEQTGIVGRMGAVFSTIEDCHIHDICNSQQLGGAETAGIKLHAAIDVTIRRNRIHNCIMGIWLDWQAQGARVSQNLMYENQRPAGLPQAQGAMFSTDVFIEVGHGPTLVDNNILMSKAAITIPSEGIACVHNLILGAFGLINSGVDSIVNDQREPRYTPYHIRHRTEVAGFMTILHGDDRIYNNIFVQKHAVTNKDLDATSSDYEVVGTAPFDIFPTYDEWYSHFNFTPAEATEEKWKDMGSWHFKHLPCWLGGNAYFNGATVCKNDTTSLVNTKDKITVELTEKNGAFSLKTNVFDFVKDFETRIITSDILGKAFEPEQRFENPDGTPITFESDFFGEHRGLSAIPGPFANEADSSKVLWK